MNLRSEPNLPAPRLRRGRGRSLRARWALIPALAPAFLLLPHLAPGVTILLKGSRGVALERLLPGLEAALSRTPAAHEGGT